MLNPVCPPATGNIKEMPDEDKRHWVRMINSRLMAAWDLKDYKAIARHLGLNDKAPTNWIQKFTIPWTAIYACHTQTGRSIEWLLHGKDVTFTANERTRHAMKLSAATLIKSSKEMQMLNFKDESLEALFIDGLVNNFLTVVASEQY